MPKLGGNRALSGDLRTIEVDLVSKSELHKQTEEQPTLERDICELLAAFVYADGDIDARELEVVKKQSARLGIRFSIFKDILDDYRLEDSKRSPVEHILERITKSDLRNDIAAAILEMMSADQILHGKERDFVSLLEESWGVTLEIIDQAIEWDPEQELVVEANPDDRVIVSAGPGMGKTAVACARVSKLVERDGLRPTAIWMVSFTRAAVGELKDRIASFAEDQQALTGLTIATIDSSAWRIRYGLTNDDAKSLFGGFDVGIESAIQAISDNSESFREFLQDIDHIIIDEAQDITGLRAEFLLKLINLAASECGFTIFHDPAQAIYEYTEDDELPQPGFVEQLKDSKIDRIQTVDLKTIHRTNDPSLLRLYEDLRLDVLSGATDRFGEQKAMVKEAAHEKLGDRFNPRAVSSYSNALVLFRKRAQALMAASFMNSENLQYRFRMSNLPNGAMPWIVLLHQHMGDRPFLKSDFEKFIDSEWTNSLKVICHHLNKSAFIEKYWSLLEKYGRTQNPEAVSLEPLREVLATRIPDGFGVHDIGVSGPIISTIHASKGREAENVILHVPERWDNRKKTSGESAEESRVLFVGASRAKNRLIVSDSLAVPVSYKSKESGRIYRRTPKGIQIQVGINGDLNELTARQNGYSPEILLSLDLPHECQIHLEQVSNGYIWKLRVNGNPSFPRPLCEFSSYFSRDLSDIGLKALKKWKAASPIRNVYIVGWHTATASELDETGDPFWLVPQLVGLPMVYFRW